MSSFSGVIDAVVPDLSSYLPGDYPALLVDFTIDAYDLPVWELEWHAYLKAYDGLAAGFPEVGETFQADFNNPWSVVWPNPDTRVVTRARLPLRIPYSRLAGDTRKLVEVDLYGSTGEFDPSLRLAFDSAWLNPAPTEKWVPVATAQVTSKGVQGDIAKTLDEMVPGQRGRLKLEAPGLGLVFNAAGVEQVAQLAFNAKGVDATVIDCWGEGINTGWIEFHASPLPIVLLIWGIAAVLAALGFVILVVALTLFVIKAPAEALKWLPIALGAGSAAAAVGGIVYLVRRH